MKINFKALMQEMMNDQLLKDKSPHLREATKVLNKYGIYGMDVAKCLTELAAVFTELEGEPQ